MYKRTLSFLLALTLAFSLTIPAFAAEGTEETTAPEEAVATAEKADGNTYGRGTANPADEPETSVESGSCGANLKWKFSRSSGTLMIEGTGPMENYTAGGAPWYSFRNDIKSIHIFEDVTSIGNYAFYDLQNLKTIQTANDGKLTTIGSMAFYHSCGDMTSFPLPETVTVLAESALAGISTQGFVVRSGSVSSQYFTVENGALYNKAKTRLIQYAPFSSGTSFTMPNTVTSVDAFAMAGCHLLTTITLSEKLKTIGEQAFAQNSIASVTIPKTVVTIGQNAFYGCEYLTSVTVLSDNCTIESNSYSGVASHTLGTPGLTVVSCNGNSTAKTFAEKNGYTVKIIYQFAAPKNVKVSNEATGVKITWTSTGAAKYRVFYKPNGGSWAKAGDTTTNSFIWTGAKSGTTYQFRVWSVSADGKKQTSTYDAVKSIKFIDVPKNVAVSNVAGGIKVTWTKVTAAAKYRVFYKPNGGNWTKAGDTTSNSFTWTGPKDGVKYQIRVACVSADGNTQTSGYSAAKSITSVYTQETSPKLSAVINAPTGIYVSWSKVSGAVRYNVYYKPEDGAWAKAGSTTGTSYTWTGAKVGITYQIRVCCASADGETTTSAYSAVKTITYKPSQFAAPKITAVTSVADGVKVTWSKVTGAAKYRVFYKAAGGSWKKAGDTTSTSYTWTGAKNGATYQIRVWCVSADGKTKTSDYDAIKTITYIYGQLPAPKISSVSNTPNGIYVTWSKVAGAEKYRVFYKAAGGSWKKAGDSTSTSYTWTGAKSGTTYQIRVWCVSADGKTQTSTYDAIKTIIYKPAQLAAPGKVAAENVADGIKVTWSKVTGAEKYRVFYKPNGGSWKKAGDTTSTSYTWTGAKSGTTYQIRVWCVSADGKTKTSDYDNIAIVKFVAAPVYTVSAPSTGGIKITWGKVTGASKYTVFYKTKGDWKKLTTTSSTSYTVKSPKDGTTYTFRVRCVNSDGDVISGYNSDTTFVYIK